MKQYLDLLNNILENGTEKQSARENMPNTIGLSHATISHDFINGFPLLTTKKVHWKGVIHELLWFLRGDTNIKYLVDNKTNIWNQDAYRWYLKNLKENNDNVNQLSFDDFVDTIKNGSSSKLFQNSEYKLGDLGKVYGHQWRNQNGVDQVQEVIEGLKTNPYSRYHIIDSWNKSDFKEMALPPCHLLYQFIVRPINNKERFNICFKDTKKYNPNNLTYNDKSLDDFNVPKFYLDLSMYQRSVDSTLGLPYNLASCGFLMLIISSCSNMIPGELHWIGGDTHIYKDHIDRVMEQIKRNPLKFPKVNLKKDIKTIFDVEKLTIDDFEVIDYNSHESIKFELFTGIKK